MDDKWKTADGLIPSADIFNDDRDNTSRFFQKSHLISDSRQKLMLFKTAYEKIAFALALFGLPSFRLTHSKRGEMEKICLKFICVFFQCLSLTYIGFNTFVYWKMRSGKTTNRIALKICEECCHFALRCILLRRADSMFRAVKKLMTFYSHVSARVEVDDLKKRMYHIFCVLIMIVILQFLNSVAVAWAAFEDQSVYKWVSFRDDLVNVTSLSPPMIFPTTLLVLALTKYAVLDLCGTLYAVYYATTCYLLYQNVDGLWKYAKSHVRSGLDKEYENLIRRLNTIENLTKSTDDLFSFPMSLVLITALYTAMDGLYDLFFENTFSEIGKVLRSTFFLLGCLIFCTTSGFASFVPRSRQELLQASYDLPFISPSFHKRLLLILRAQHAEIYLTMWQVVNLDAGFILTAMGTMASSFAILASL